MRTSRWIIGGVSVVLCALGTSSANQATIAERIAVQQARLPQIEELAARERERIGQWYESRRAEVVREVAQREAAKLSLAQRSLWVEFAKMEDGRPYAHGYFDASQFGFPFSYETTLLRQAMIEEYFSDEMASLLRNDDFSRKLTQIAEGRLKAAATPQLQRQARELLALTTKARAELTTELGHLENARDGRLEATMEWERNLKEQVRDILEHLRQSESKEPQLGVVESIGYFPRSGYFCMVEGVDRVLSPGDTIGQVRVLSIDPQKVKFGKDGDTWAQPLGAPAQPHWQ